MLLLIVVGMKYNQTLKKKKKNTHEWEYVCVSINKSALYVLEKLFYLQIWTVKHNNSIHEQPRPIHNDAFAAGIHQCEIKNPLNQTLALCSCDTPSMSAWKVTPLKMMFRSGLFNPNNRTARGATLLPCSLFLAISVNNTQSIVCGGLEKHLPRPSGGDPVYLIETAVSNWLSLWNTLPSTFVSPPPL